MRASEAMLLSGGMSDQTPQADSRPQPSSEPSPWGAIDRFFFPLGALFLLVGVINMVTNSNSGVGLTFLCVGVVWISLGITAVNRKRQANSAGTTDGSGANDG